MNKIMQTKRDSFFELLMKIESNFPLAYSDEINKLFEAFVKGLDMLSIDDEALRKRLNRIWAERGFSMEKYFAQQQNIQSFDFYPKYKKLMKFDSLMLRKVI